MKSKNAKLADKAFKADREKYYGKPPTKLDRIVTLEGQMRVAEDTIRLLAATVEKLVEVVCQSDATERIAAKEGLTARIPF